MASVESVPVLETEKDLDVDESIPPIDPEDEKLACSLQSKATQMKANIQETLQELKKTTDAKFDTETIAQVKLADFEQTISKSMNAVAPISVTANACNCGPHETPTLDTCCLTEPIANANHVKAAANKPKDRSEKRHSPVKAKSTEPRSSCCNHAHPHSHHAPTSPVITNNSAKRKTEKTIDQVQKWLASCGGSTIEEKLQLLCRKHVEVLDESRNVDSKWKQSDRQCNLLLREKEQLQAEHSRVLLIRSRLEGLCRELQRQNRAVKDESLLRLREEEERRKEISSKFQGTLNDITSLTQENQQRNNKLKEENDELAQKLKGLIEHYEAWEKHNEKVTHQKELECELAKAKLAKCQLQLRQAQEEHLAERQRLIATLEALQERCTLLASNEVQVRNELALYTTKYEEFQTVLTNSNQVFGSFKTDMEKMSKKIKSLEKETSQWKSRWESSNLTLIEMAADKQKRDQELVSAHQKVNTLDKLCRALQTERVSLLAKIKSATSTPALVDPPNNKSEEVKENDEMTLNLKAQTDSTAAAVVSVVQENESVISSG